MTDAASTAHNGADLPVPSKEHEHSSWATNFASSVWGMGVAAEHVAAGGVAAVAADVGAGLVAAAGAGRVAEHVIAGFAKEVYEHPLQTAAEVAGGIAVAAVATEVGIGVVASAAIGGVALAGYGAMRGAQIAATEGVGAIPEHMRAAYDDASKSVSSMVDAASTIYNGESGQKERDAAAKLENVGRAIAPVAAMLVGGTGAEMGQAAIRGGLNALNDILPALSFEPEFAYAGASGMTGGALSAITAPARISAEAVAMTGFAGATISERSAHAPNFSSQREFVSGIKPKPVEATPGIGAKISEDLKRIDEIIAKGGVKGNIKYADDGNGMITFEFTDGPMAGRTGLYERGAKKFSFDGVEGRTTDFEIK